MTNEERQRRGLRRHALVFPVMDRVLERGEKTAILREQGAKYGVSMATLKRYCKAVREQSTDGLFPAAERADKHKPRKIAPEILELATALRSEKPTRTTTTIIEMLENEHPELKGQIKRSTLDRHLHRLGKSRADLRVVEAKPRRQWSKIARNAMWQTDLCMLSLYAHDEYGEVRPVIVVAMLDDATRYFVHLEAHLTQDAGVVESCFRKAAIKHGLPLAVFFDNGSQFVCEQFTGALQALGVLALRASPGSPESKGKVERSFQTLQTSLLPELQALAGTLSLVEVNQYLAAWVARYHDTAHSELSKETPTPAKRWEADQTELRAVDPVKLEAAFLLRTERKVSRVQLVELNGRRYLAGEVAPGTRVEVRYHPRQAERVQIWRDGEFVQVAPLYLTPEDVPKLPPVKPVAPGPGTGLNFAQMLLERHQEQLRQQYRQAGFAGTAPEPASFTEGAFLALLKRRLGRELESFEQDLALQTWHLFGRLDQSWTEAALHRFSQQRGLDMHIAYYLEAVANEHRRRGVKLNV